MFRNIRDDESCCDIVMKSSTTKALISVLVGCRIHSKESAKLQAMNVKAKALLYDGEAKYLLSIICTDLNSQKGIIGSQGWL